MWELQIPLLSNLLKIGEILYQGFKMMFDDEKVFHQVIMLLWFGGLEAKPDKNRFNDGALFSSEVFSSITRILIDDNACEPVADCLAMSFVLLNVDIQIEIS